MLTSLNTFVFQAIDLLRKVQGAVRLRVRKCGPADHPATTQGSLQLGNTLGKIESS